MIGRADVERSTGYLEEANFMVLREEMVFIRKERPGMAAAIDMLFETLPDPIRGESDQARISSSLGIAIANFYLRNNAFDYEVTRIFTPQLVPGMLIDVSNPDGIEKDKIDQFWAEISLREHWLTEEMELFCRSYGYDPGYFKLGALQVLVPYLVCKSLKDGSSWQGDRLN